jgi:hypothetical protein
MRTQIGGFGMGWRSRRAGKRVVACVIVGGVGVIAGWLAGFSNEPVETMALSAWEPALAPTTTSELSPAQIVAMRFQPNSFPVAAAPAGYALTNVAKTAAPKPRPAAPAPGGYALASAAETPVPAPVSAVPAAPGASAPAGYAMASAANTTPAASRQIFYPYPTYASLADTSLADRTVDDAAPAPEQALAYAPPAAASAVAPAVAAEHATSPGTAAAAAIKRVVAPPHPASASNTVLNNAQIASIHERLQLSSYQQQLWPPVESALRDIAYRQARNDASRKSTYRNEKEPALIDTGSPEVQRLKSAAIPLIMSMNEEQKQEVRTLARLMGLEQLASSF